MRIIQPFDLNEFTPEYLLKVGKILGAEDNMPWHATIFPNSFKDTLSQFLKIPYDKDNVITFIDDQFYTDYNLTILTKKEQLIFVNNNTGKKVIKCKEYGDYDNSVKRYTVLNKPIDYNKDNEAINFLNISKPLSTSLNVIKPNLQFNPGNIFVPVENKSPEAKLFGKTVNHPHISAPKSKGLVKHNNKPIINSIFEWIVSQGIKYVYSINEWRPNVIDDNYVTNLVYYTVTGAK